MAQWLQDWHLAIFGVIWIFAVVLTVMALGQRKKGALSVRFWQIQGILQIAVLIQAALGIAMVGRGMHPKDPLHYMYGGLVVLCIGVERGLMPGHRLRTAIIADWGQFSEGWGFAVLNLLILALSSRAAMTGLWGF